MKFLTRDRALALATLLLVIILFVESADIPGRTSWQPYGSAFFPRLLTGALGVLAVLLLGRTIFPRSRKAPPLMPELRNFVATQRRVIALFALFAIYVALLPIVHFVWATIIFLLVSFAALMSERNGRNLVAASTVAVVTTLLVFAIFQYGLGIRLP